MSHSVENTKLPPEYGVEIFHTLTGSASYGLDVAGVSDRDELGVCIEHPNFRLGLDEFEQWRYRNKPEGERSDASTVDVVVYSLRKWAKLAANGNPNILETLFVPDSCVLLRGTAFDRFMHNKNAFVSKRALRRYLGYMQSQRDKMVALTGKAAARKDLISQFGYDTKFAYHLIRLGLQGNELADTGSITLPMSPENVSDLKSVRNGEYSKEFILSWASDLEQSLCWASHNSSLPAEPDKQRINSMLEETYMFVWEHPTLFV